MEEKQTFLGSLKREMELALDELRDNLRKEVDDAAALREAEEEVVVSEMTAIREWLEGIPAEDIKAVYGSNETERQRNTTLMLEENDWVLEARARLAHARNRHACTKAEVEYCRERVRNLRAMAYAYAGERMELVQ